MARSATEIKALLQAAATGDLKAADDARREALHDRTDPFVTLTATGTLNRTAHAGKILKLNKTGAAVTITLPAATGSGDRYEFIVEVVNTSNYVIQKNGSDVLYGQINLHDVDATTAANYTMTGTTSNDVITLNGTTTGGQIGDRLLFTDLTAGKWSVQGWLTCPAGSNVATPLS